MSDYPDGRDAAINATSNLRFRNDTPGELTITGTCDGLTSIIEISGTYDGRTVAIRFSGFTDELHRRSCTVVRTVTYEDGTTRTDTFDSVYSVLPYVEGTGSAATTTGP